MGGASLKCVSRLLCVKWFLLKCAVGCWNDWEWEVLPEIRLLGATFWRGLSNHQAAAAQVGTWQAESSPRIDKYRRVPTPLRRPSPFSESWEYLELPWLSVLWRWTPRQNRTLEAGVCDSTSNKTILSYFESTSYFGSPFVFWKHFVRQTTVLW